MALDEGNEYVNETPVIPSNTNDQISRENVDQWSVKIKTKNKRKLCLFFVSPRKRAVLLRMPDSELLERLCIICHSIEVPHHNEVVTNKNNNNMVDYFLSELDK